MKKYILIIFLSITSLVFSFIKEKEIYTFLGGGNYATSSYVFSELISNKVKSNDMKKLDRVRCVILGINNTDNGGATMKDRNGRTINTPNVGVLIYVSNCTRATGFGSSKTNLTALYALGRDGISRYTNIQKGNVRVFARVATVDRKKSLIGFIY